MVFCTAFGSFFAVAKIIIVLYEPMSKVKFFVPLHSNLRRLMLISSCKYWLDSMEIKIECNIAASKMLGTHEKIDCIFHFVNQFLENSLYANS